MEGSGKRAKRSSKQSPAISEGLLVTFPHIAGMLGRGLPPATARAEKKVFAVLRRFGMSSRPCCQGGRVFIRDENIPDFVRRVRQLEDCQGAEFGTGFTSGGKCGWNFHENVKIERRKGLSKRKKKKV